MPKKMSFLEGRLRGGKYALKGAWILISTEPSIQVQSVVAGLMVLLGFYIGITPTEWMFQIFAIGLVISIEGLNTAAEGIADFVHPDFHTKIGYIKDVAAGAVFIAAITAAITGLIIYVPYFI